MLWNIKNASGESYEGQWQNDIRHGTGKYKYKNGDYSKGQYILGKEDGNHILTQISTDKNS